MKSYEKKCECSNQIEVKKWEYKQISINFFPLNLYFPFYAQTKRKLLNSTVYTSFCGGPQQFTVECFSTLFSARGEFFFRSCCYFLLLFLNCFFTIACSDRLFCTIIVQVVNTLGILVLESYCCSNEHVHTRRWLRKKRNFKLKWQKTCVRSKCFF